MALMYARIGVRAGESGLASARLACSSRLVRSSSLDVSRLTSCGRLGSGTGDPLTVFLLGYHFVKPGLQVSPYRRYWALRVEVRNGALKQTAEVAQLEGGQRAQRMLRLLDSY